MRVEEILSLADSLKKNEISEEVKLHWLNELEGRVHCEIFKRSIDDVVKLTALNQELSIPAPYTNVYISYLLSMIAFATKEYELYADLMMKYERDFSQYAKFCLRAR